MGTAPALWMLASALAFATMGAQTFALGGRCDWLLIALVRAIAMFLMAVGLAWRKGVALPVFHPRTLWLRSLTGSLSLVCNFYAMTRLPVADVLTITNTYPLWILILTAVAYHVMPTRGEVLGVIIGLAGVVLVQRPHLGGDRLASSLAVVASLSTAVAMLGLHRLRNVDARAIVAHFAGVAAILSLIWMAARGWPLGPRADEPVTWLLLAGVAVSGTIGQFFLTKAYASGPPGEVAVISLSQVAFGLMFDILVWGRQVEPLSWLGFALVLAPTAWLAGRAGSRSRQAAVATRAAATKPEPRAYPVAADTP
jgi:drug/metabolite transporter (DMT)-like permease